MWTARGRFSQRWLHEGVSRALMRSSRTPTVRRLHSAVAKHGDDERFCRAYFRMVGVNVQVQPAFLVISDFLSGEMRRSSESGSPIPKATGEITPNASGRKSRLAATVSGLPVQNCATWAAGYIVSTCTSRLPSGLSLIR